MLWMLLLLSVFFVLSSILSSIIYLIIFLNLRILWFGKPELFPPQKERASKTMHGALYPFEVQIYVHVQFCQWIYRPAANLWSIACVKQCRQAKLSYTGKFLVDICFQYGDGAVIREKFNFGQFPIMLKVSFIFPQVSANFC